MNKKLLLHVLENIDDNGGWIWSGDLLLYENERAQLRFEQSGYSAEEYITAGIMLVEIGGPEYLDPTDSIEFRDVLDQVDTLDFALLTQCISPKQCTPVGLLSPSPLG